MEGFSISAPPEETADESRSARPESPVSPGTSEKIADLEKKVKAFVDDGGLSFADIKKVRRLLSKEIINMQAEVMTSDAEDSESRIRELVDISKEVDEKARVEALAHFAQKIDLSGYECPSGNEVEIAAQANYEGDKTILLVDRIQDPTIREQLVRVLQADRECDMYFDGPSSKETIQDELGRMLKEVSSNTPVTFTGEMPSANKIDGVRENFDVLWRPVCQPFEEYGPFQKNYVEAHEKGHSLRKIRSFAAETYIGKAFDFGAIHVSPERIIASRLYHTREGFDADEASDQQIADAVIEYLMEPAELVERMSQLKNYFGMKGHEPFTRAHLEYARAHYLADTKMDNNMSEFFAAITPETEKTFLTYINNLGV